MPDSPDQPPPRVWINPRPPRTLEDQLHDGGIWHYDGAPDDIPYVPEAHAAALQRWVDDPKPAQYIASLEKRVAALQAQLDAAVKMNRELKIIVDIGTDDDPGTALSKLHKIQHQAVEQFRRRAVEAFRDTAKVWRERGKVQVASQCEDAADFIQQLPAIPVTKEGV